VFGTSASVRVREIPIPAGRDHRGNPLISPVCTVLPRRLRAAGRARDHCRSCHGVSVGAAVHPLTDRHSTTVSTCARRPLVCRWDL